MPKQHRDVVVLVLAGAQINALVSTSQTVVITPATQTEPAVSAEHLTLVYLDPKAEAPRMTGDQLRDSIKTIFDVVPLELNPGRGWKNVDQDAETAAKVREISAGFKSMLDNSQKAADEKFTEVQQQLWDAKAKLKAQDEVGKVGAVGGQIPIQTKSDEQAAADLADPSVAVPGTVANEAQVAVEVPAAQPDPLAGATAK